MEKPESKPADEKKYPLYIPTDGIGTRIADTAVLLGTRKNAAEVMGISADSLQRYIRGEVKPSIDAVALLAQATGACLKWLITGRGAPGGTVRDAGTPYEASRSGETLYLSGFSPEDIEGIVRLLESREEVRAMPPDAKAKFIRDLLEEEERRRARGRQEAQRMLQEGPPQADG